MSNVNFWSFVMCHVLGQCWTLGRGKKVTSGNCHENKLFPGIESYPDQFVQTPTLAVSQTVESCQFVTVAVELSVVFFGDYCIS